MEEVKDNSIKRVIIYGLMIFLFLSFLAGCSKRYAFELNQQTLTLEYGESLPNNLLEFVDLDDKEKNDVSYSSDDITNFTDVLEVGDYSITYSYHDNEETLQVIVRDTTASEVTIADNIEVVENQAIDYEEYVTVSDLSEYEIAFNDNEVDYSTLGEYEVIVVVTDKYDNSTTESFIITVSEPVIELSEESLDLFIDESEQLIVSTNSDAPLTFTSSDEEIVRVDDLGEVKAVSAGEAIITVSNGDIETNCKVTVKELTLELSKDSVSILCGKSKTITASTNSKETVTFESADENIATVDKNGKIEGINAGKTTITAKVGNKSAKCKVTVKDVTLELSKDSLSIVVGSSKSLTADTNSNNKITYKSSDKSIATVSNEGKIKGIAPGKATITVKVANKKATCEVTVKDITLELSDNSLTITKGKSKTITATTNSKDTVTFKSSDSDIATVDSSGKIKGIKVGTVTITATVGDKSAKCKVTIKKATSNSSSSSSSSSSKSSSSSSDSDNYPVLVTKNGKKYHLDGCRTISGSKTTTMTKKETVKQGYTPCGVCHPY